MLKRIWKYLTYSAYDRRGRLKMILDRTPDRRAFENLDVPESIVDMVLSGICESFDIDPSQKYQLRTTDNLADIYRAITRYRLGDDLEYERLHMKIEEWIGEFDFGDLSKDINLTIGAVIEYVSGKLTAQADGSAE